MLQFAANPKSDTTSKKPKWKTTTKHRRPRQIRKIVMKSAQCGKSQSINQSINQSITQYVPLSRWLQSCLQEVGARTSRLVFSHRGNCFTKTWPGIKPDQNMEIGSWWQEAKRAVLQMLFNSIA